MYIIMDAMIHTKVVLVDEGCCWWCNDGGGGLRGSKKRGSEGVRVIRSEM